MTHMTHNRKGDSYGLLSRCGPPHRGHICVLQPNVRPGRKLRMDVYARTPVVYWPAWACRLEGGVGVGWIKRHWSQPRETELPQADSRVRGHPMGGMVCQAPTSQLYHWYVMAVCHRGWWAVGRHVQHG